MVKIYFLGILDLMFWTRLDNFYLTSGNTFYHYSWVDSAYLSFRLFPCFWDLPFGVQGWQSFTPITNFLDGLVQCG